MRIGYHAEEFHAFWMGNETMCRSGVRESLLGDFSARLGHEIQVLISLFRHQHPGEIVERVNWMAYGDAVADIFLSVGI